MTMKPHSGTLVIDISGVERAEDYEGVYQCTARNEHGTALSNNIVIRQSSTFELFLHNLAALLACPFNSFPAFECIILFK